VVPEGSVEAFRNGVMGQTCDLDSGSKSDFFCDEEDVLEFFQGYIEQVVSIRAQSYGLESPLLQVREVSPHLVPG